MNILILIPHQDDEIILCGSFLNSLIVNGHDVHVVFMTNGNYEPSVHTIRLEEALQVMAWYGVPEDHVVFMGYANEYDARGPHIYNAPHGMVLRSQYGTDETHGLPTHPDHCYQKHGVHHKYTRENLVGDLYEIMNELRPEVIFATGEEIHPDHSANSLFLDEVLGKILHENVNYRPWVLKKPEYSTAWFGPEDFSETDNPPATFDYKRPYVFVNGHRSWFYDPYLRWKDRVRILAEPDAPTMVRRALELYASQNAIQHFKMLLNRDVVFWPRRTDSLMYGAKVGCSSGNTVYLHDFKRNDTNDLKRKQRDIWKQNVSIWRPDENDVIPVISIQFKQKCVIHEIVIYQEFCPKCLITMCHIEDGDGRLLWKGALEKKRATLIKLNDIETKKFSIKIIGRANQRYQPGITEIEVFSKDGQTLLENIFKNLGLATL